MNPDKIRSAWSYAASPSPCGLAGSVMPPALRQAELTVEGREPDGRADQDDAGDAVDPDQRSTRHQVAGADRERDVAAIGEERGADLNQSKYQHLRPGGVVRIDKLGDERAE